MSERYTKLCAKICQFDVFIYPVKQCKLTVSPSTYTAFMLAIQPNKVVTLANCLHYITLCVYNLLIKFSEGLHLIITSLVCTR